MLDTPRPRDIVNMDQAIDAILDFNKSAEVSQVTHAALHARAYLIAFIECAPGIFLNLLHSQANASGLRINGKHFNLDCISRTDYLAGMLDAFGPAHLRNMDQALNAVFELYESTVIGNAGNLTGHTSVQWKALFDRGPWIRQ